MSQRLSPHAVARSSQRCVRSQHVEVALRWGAAIPQADGRVAYHVGRRELREATRAGCRLPDKALGLIVVVAADGTVVTVVRSNDRHRLRLPRHRSAARSRRTC